jgi:trans-aconitate methyltransferase
MVVASTSGSGSMGDLTYQLPNEWTQARRRLELLAATADPTTVDRLGRVGIKPGHRVLEVGGGGGSITRWLCDTVGPQGVVHSVDIDTRFIEEIRLPQLHVQRADVRKAALAEGTFDLIHTRYLLAHLPDRDAVVDRLAQSLAPGGWLVVEEIDFFPIAALDHGVWAEALNWYTAAMTDAGADTGWGHQLASRLDTAGLADVYADARLEFFAGASPRAELWTLTYTQMWDKLRAAGAPDRLHDELLTALADRTRRFPDFASIGAWGCRP